MKTEMKYMLLSRLQADCKYFLGNGNKNIKHLFHETPQMHIKEMLNLWNSFTKEQKPDWLTYDEIKDFEKEMCK